MIKELKLVCSGCKKAFTAEGILYYRLDLRKAQGIDGAELICPECLSTWHSHWQIVSADFYEKDYSLYVNLTLKDGTVFTGLDCTVLDGIAVTSQDMPEEAKKFLFEHYTLWKKTIQRNILQKCTFREEFMRTTFTCETYGGEEYKDIPFRFNSRGEFETEAELPEYIKEQVIAAWKHSLADN